MEPRPPGHEGPAVEAVETPAAPGAALASDGGVTGAPGNSTLTTTPRPVLLLNKTSGRSSLNASDLSLQQYDTLETGWLAKEAQLLFHSSLL